MRLSPADKLSLYTRAGVNALGLLGRQTHPPAILWVVTQRCFYQCIHCDSWRDERPIDAEALLGIADQIAEAPTQLVALSGGEPFIVKRLPEIVSRLKRAKKIVSINTNGHLLAEHADWLVTEAVDHVQVSIDGHTAALHDGIRRQRGSFEQILRGIEALKSKRNRTPSIGICGVLMKENAAHLAELVDRFSDVADTVELQPLHQSPGLLATAGAAPFAATDRAVVEEQLATIMARHPEFANDFYRTIPRFLFDHASMEHFAVDHCLPMIFNTLTIREDGVFRICRYPLHASIFEKRIVEIWNSPARWDLYRSLVRDGCGEPCWLRCHAHPSAVPGRMLRKVVQVLG